MNIQVQQKAGEAPFKLKYGNYVGGKWVEPKSGRYMDNLSPVTGHKICEVPRSDAACEIAEMVDGERDIRIGGFTQWLAVIPGFSPGDEI